MSGQGKIFCIWPKPVLKTGEKKRIYNMIFEIKELKQS
jgi:hypothetical protein